MNITRWVVDEEGCLGLEFFWGLFTIIKYKHSRIYRWLCRLEQAPKY